MHPVLALIIANTIWGAASPIFKLALENIPPFTLAFIRFYFAALLFFPFIRFEPLRALSKKEWFLLFLGAFLTISLNIVFFFLGLQRTQSINAPIIASAAPLFLFLGSIFVLKEKPTFRVLVGMTISFLGVLIIIFIPYFLKEGTFQAKDELLGNMLFVGSVLANIAGTLVLKKVMDKVSPLVVTGSGFLFSAVTFAPFMIVEFQTWDISMLNGAGWLGIVFGVFFSSAAAYFLYYYGISKIKAQEVGVFSYLDPVVGVLLAALLLHEYPTLYFFIGSVFVFGGILIAQRRIPYHPFRRLKETVWPL
ncbi:DMT family transporter [Candidatus Roizmanbacteria bacterium]|nr:DMT family transporter [Candidatus Roizmanbacteria bacterium]